MNENSYAQHSSVAGVIASVGHQGYRTESAHFGLGAELLSYVRGTSTHIHVWQTQTAAWTLQECTTHLHVRFALNNWNTDFNSLLKNLPSE